jgi:aminodeoxyfutalosine deaminase
MVQISQNISLVHGNYLQAKVPKGASLIYCPRTHAAFGHAPHPFRRFLAQGLNVALGTDSLASNADLNLLAEMRFLHKKNPDVPGATILNMATSNGALALGWAEETGSLTPGKSADFVVLSLLDEEPTDPHKLVLESELPVKEVYFQGKAI